MNGWWNGEGHDAKRISRTPDHFSPQQQQPVNPQPPKNLLPPASLALPDLTPLRTGTCLILNPRVCPHFLRHLIDTRCSPQAPELLQTADELTGIWFPALASPHLGTLLLTLNEKAVGWRGTQIETGDTTISTGAARPFPGW